MSSPQKEHVFIRISREEQPAVYARSIDPSYLTVEMRSHAAAAACLLLSLSLKERKERRALVFIPGPRALDNRLPQPSSHHSPQHKHTERNCVLSIEQTD